MVVYRAPAWRVLTTALPSCTPLHQLELDQVGPLYECQQIRSYKSTAVILFTEKKSEQVSEGTRSVYTAVCRSPWISVAGPTTQLTM